MASTQTKPPNPFDPAFSYESDKSIFLFTSLTAGSSHIVSATARMETILKANRITYYAIDCATDEKARRIWTRRGGGKRLPGLVREGVVLGDLEKIEEWNEFGEIKMKLGGAPLPKKVIPARPTPASATKKENAPPAASPAPAPPAPPMPVEHADQPDKAKTAQDKSIPERTKPAEPPGQASLAGEVAAAALKRKQEKAAAFKAKYSKKDEPTKDDSEKSKEETAAADNKPNKSDSEKANEETAAADNATTKADPEEFKEETAAADNEPTKSDLEKSKEETAATDKEPTKSEPGKSKEETAAADNATTKADPEKSKEETVAADKPAADGDGEVDESKPTKKLPQTAEANETESTTDSRSGEPSGQPEANAEAATTDEATTEPPSVTEKDNLVNESTGAEKNNPIAPADNVTTSANPANHVGTNLEEFAGSKDVDSPSKHPVGSSVSDGTSSRITSEVAAGKDHVDRSEVKGHSPSNSEESAVHTPKLSNDAGKTVISDAASVEGSTAEASSKPEQTEAASKTEAEHPTMEQQAAASAEIEHQLEAVSKSDPSQRATSDVEHTDETTSGATNLADGSKHNEEADGKHAQSTTPHSEVEKAKVDA